MRACLDWARYVALPETDSVGIPNAGSRWVSFRKPRFTATVAESGTSRDEVAAGFNPSLAFDELEVMREGLLQNHFLNPAVQFSTTVIGANPLSGVAVLMRNRFPFPETSQ